jgi:hypothetical protein
MTHLLVSLIANTRKADFVGYLELTLRSANIDNPGMSAVRFNQWYEISSA